MNLLPMLFGLVAGLTLAAVWIHRFRKTRIYSAWTERGKLWFLLTPSIPPLGFVAMLCSGAALLSMSRLEAACICAAVWTVLFSYVQTILFLSVDCLRPSKKRRSLFDKPE